MEYADDEVVLRTLDGYASMEEAHIPDGVTTIPDRHFTYYNAIKRVYVPRSVRRIGSEIFWSPAMKDNIEVFYEGDSTAWRAMTENITEYRYVYYSGAYDKYPYYNDTGSEYRRELVRICFYRGTTDLRVHCEADGVTLEYNMTAKAPN